MKSIFIIAIIFSIVAIGISLFLYDQYKSAKETERNLQELDELSSEVDDILKNTPSRTVHKIYESDLDVDLVSCSSEYGYVNWKGSVTSLANEPINVNLVLTGIDENGDVVTFVEEIIIGLNPGKTEYVDRLLDDVSGFDTCDFKIESIIPSR